MTATLWESLSISLPKNATGPEVFKVIIDKCTGITKYSILKIVDKPICPDISIFSSEGESQTPSSKSEKRVDKPIFPNISILSSEGESQPPSCVNEKTLTEGESQPSSKSHIHTDTKRQPSSIGLQFLNAFYSLDKEN